MNGPAEAFGLLQVGMFKGIPALQLRPRETPIDDGKLLDLLARSAQRFGLDRPGKLFICISREVDPALVRLFKKAGAFVIASCPPLANPPWVREANHVQVITQDGKWLGQPCDSFVFVPYNRYDSGYEEPKFNELVRLVPKFIVVESFDGYVEQFLSSSEYPWAVQLKAPVMRSAIRIVEENA